MASRQFRNATLATCGAAIGGPSGPPSGGDAPGPARAPRMAPFGRGPGRDPGPDVGTPGAGGRHPDSPAAGVQRLRPAHGADPGLLPGDPRGDGARPAPLGDVAGQPGARRPPGRGWGVLVAPALPAGPRAGVHDVGPDGGAVRPGGSVLR